MKRDRPKRLLLSGALVACLAVLLVLRSRTQTATGPPEIRTDDARPATVSSPRRPPTGPGRWERPPLPPADILVPPAGSPAAKPPTATKRDRDAIPGEYVLSFGSEAERNAFIRLAEAKGGRILQVMGLGNSVRLRMEDRGRFDELLAEGPQPEEWSSNYFVRYPDPEPRDPLQPESGYTPFGNAALQWLGVTGDNAAWGNGITVAVLDTGIGRHPALQEGNITRLDPDGNVTGVGADLPVHGTAVASLIAGLGENISGVSPSARLLSIQVLGSDGTGDTFTLAQAIVQAVDHGARVINMCLGSYGDSYILRNAVNYALQAGVVLVGATGNDAVEGVMYPAKYDGVLAVAGVDGAQHHLYFSNRGREVDIAAPGMAVNAAAADNGTVLFSGTSAAVPFVSGALAWLMSENPGMKPEEAVALLLKYADDAGAPGPDDKYGEGILNIERIADRNVRGIYNAAAGAPYLKDTDGPPTLVVFLQNRGTEELRAVDLRVELDGIPRVASFYNVGVGETVSTEYVLDTERLMAGNIMTVVCTAVIDGVEDAYPGDNTRSSRIYAPAAMDGNGR